MPFVTGTAPTEDTTGTFREAGHQKLFRAFRRYVTGSPDPGTPTDPGPANTGTGYIRIFDTKPGSAAQTWTFTCTTGGANAVFSVTGSVSGAQAALTTNTNYENSHIAVRIEDGGTTFVAGGTPDDFQVVTTASGNSAANDQWSIEANYDYFGQNGVNGAALGTPNHEIVLKGIGLAGADEVFVGIRLVGQPADSVHNWEIKGLTGASGSSTFDLQPGASPSVFTAFWDQSIPYWFVVNGRRFIVVGKVSGNAHSLYGGLILPFSTPTEYPYPLFVGGAEDAATVHSNTGANFSFFVDPQANAARLRDNVGAWNGFQKNNGTNYAVWPYHAISTTFNSSSRLTNTRRHFVTAESVLFPCVVITGASATAPHSNSVVGTLDGVFAIPGDGVSFETLVNIGGTDYLVVRNIFRTANNNFMAVRLD